MTENMQKFLDVAKTSDDMKKEIDEIEEKFQNDINEELQAIEGHGGKLEKDDVIHGNKRALRAFRKVVKADEKLDIKTKKFEDKLQKRADKYIELAKKYGIELQPEDFVGDDDGADEA